LSAEALAKADVANSGEKPKGGFMPKRAHPCDQELVAYARYLVKGKRAAKLQKHFGRCPVCYDRLQDILIRLRRVAKAQ